MLLPLRRQCAVILSCVHCASAACPSGLARCPPLHGAQRIRRLAEGGKPRVGRCPPRPLLCPLARSRPHIACALRPYACAALTVPLARARAQNGDRGGHGGRSSVAAAAHAVAATTVAATAATTFHRGRTAQATKAAPLAIAASTRAIAATTRAAAATLAIAAASLVIAAATLATAAATLAIILASLATAAAARATVACPLPPARTKWWVAWTGRCQHLFLCVRSNVESVSNGRRETGRDKHRGLNSNKKVPLWTLALTALYPAQAAVFHGLGRSGP